MNQGFDSREIYTDLPDEVVEFHGKGPLGLEPPLRCRSVLAGCAQVGGEVPLTLPKDGRFECTSHAKRKEKKRKKKTFLLPECQNDAFTHSEEMLAFA